MEDPGLHFYDREIRAAKERLNPVFGMSPEEDWPEINGQNMEIIFDHLISAASFPFPAEFSMPDPEKGGETITDIMVENILDPDSTEAIDSYGLICDAHDEKGSFKVPLSEIVIKQDDPNYHLIEDYCIWYWEVKSP
ncbi:MAG: hypothetical protein OEV66_04545 [Spirochaetia bacterium]|nr:hypothetical protein [Spirochaetia bacterium]